MPQALRAEWWDLEGPGDEPFLAWLQHEHLPALQAVSGIGWTGLYRIAEKPAPTAEGSTPARRETTEPVPPGRQFVLLTSGALETLLAPSPALEGLDAALPLSRRRHWREAVFIEEQRIDGPDSSRFERDRSPPPAMQLGNFIIGSPEAERQMASYYRRHRFRQVEKTRGCIGARKYVSSVGWPKHGILYEFADMGREDHLFEARMNASIPDLRWNGPHPLHMVTHAPHAPHAGRRIWPPVDEATP